MYLFDFDGTLVDSVPIFMNTMRRIAREGNIPCDDALLQKLVPLGLSGLSDYFIELGLDVPKDVLMKRVMDYMTDDYLYTIPAKDRVPETLHRLKGEGHSLNVLTASPHMTLDPCLKRLGLWDLFDHVWSCDDFATTKSNPDIYRRVAVELGVAEEKVLFLDDNLGAVQTAKRAGMATCGVYDAASRDQETALRAAADLYIRDFSELLTVRF